jgi:uncharacterized membrane protein
MHTPGGDLLFCFFPQEGPAQGPEQLIMRQIESYSDGVFRYLPIVPALSYPLTAHFAASRHSVSVTLLAIALLAATALIPSLIRGRPAAWLALPLIVAGLWLLGRLHINQLPLYVPPVLVPAFMAWVFGHTLAKNRVPLIEQLVRLLHPPEAPPEPAVWVYARRLTLMWTVLFIVIATVNLVLAAAVRPEGLLLAAGAEPPFTVSQESWSLFANLIGYLLVGAFFLVEYAYRRRRFPQQPYRNLFDFIRQALAATPQLMKSER